MGHLNRRLNRRRVLRGMVNGGAVTVALPLLNCFLNGNGTALASGAPLPVRFGTWFWGLGMNKSVFVPKKIGADYDLPEEIEALKNVRQHINVITNAAAYRDNAQNLCHYTGWIIGRTGMAPSNANDKPGETFDVTIANQIGRTTRFRLLTATATGDVRTSYSYENANSPNAPDVAPLTFYTRLFGPDFQDPNAPAFTPNPRVMVRKSALSGVMEEAKAMERVVGAEDKARLDQYFTGLRHLEQQFDQQLTKPAPNAACHPGAAPKDELKAGGDTVLTAQRHNMMTDLMVMAVACDQTRVFNMSYSNATANTTKTGYEKPHHTTTHEEPIDNTLGYQPNASWFTRRSMESWAYFVEAFAKMKEGDGTLLDNVLIYADTDVGYARVHSLDGMAMFTAGRAGGKIKSGLHIDLAGTPGARLNLTAMHAMGLSIDSWGAKSNATSKPISEIMT
jgi:hypothetical protein